jgi:hypothetical protein
VPPFQDFVFLSTQHSKELQDTKIADNSCNTFKPVKKCCAYTRRLTTGFSKSESLDKIPRQLNAVYIFTSLSDKQVCTQKFPD